MYCRPPEEADSQAVRAAVLLDELDFPGFGVPDPRKAPILVEVKSENAVRLLAYSCSKRVHALPTAVANARRYTVAAAAYLHDYCVPVAHCGEGYACGNFMAVSEQLCPCIMRPSDVTCSHMVTGMAVMWLRHAATAAISACHCIRAQLVVGWSAAACCF